MKTSLGLGVVAASVLFAGGLTLSAQQRPAGLKARVVQTNAAGDNVHVIDPATNKVVGIINDIEVPHGVTLAPVFAQHVEDDPVVQLGGVVVHPLRVRTVVPDHVERDAFPEVGLEGVHAHLEQGA